jgi:uncharacterized membrane protein
MLTDVFDATRVRVAVMVIVGGVVGAATAFAGAWPYAASAGWDAAALLFVVWVGIVILRMDPKQTARHATREDPGRFASDVIVVVAAMASLVAVGAMLVAAGSAKGSTRDAVAGFALASIALSWFTVHTLFTLRYARAYYTGPDGGIDFNQHAAPRYLDFAYLAFTIGMTFQVSDTDLKTPEIRGIALRHALLSYLFGAVILASTINLIAGLAGSSGGG